MRIVVFSDSHRHTAEMETVLKRQKNSEVVLFLGDGNSDMELLSPRFPEKAFFRVAGNCDLSCELPLCQTVALEGHRIYMTHGHHEQVKFDLTRLIGAAKENHCDIAVFGHTHEAMTAYRDEIYLLNPGTIGNFHFTNGKTYGIIDIAPSGVALNIVRFQP